MRFFQIAARLSSPLRLGLAALALASACPVPSWGCASIVTGTDTVQIAEESAIIVWDKQHGVEHFIRRASFQTKAHDFGFLVPSPTTPTLKAVGDAGFSRLEQAIEPPVIVRPHRRLVWTSWLLGSKLRAGFSTAAANINTTDDDVQVEAQQRVGDYDTAVLSANDPRALNRWFRKHGYESRPALVAWLRPYVAAHWKITAFKLAKSAGATAEDTSLDTSAVRMSFATTRPFFPYREPADARDPKTHHPQRWLRVFFIGPGRMAGVIGGVKATTWPGQTDWAAALPDNPGPGIASDLGLTTPQLPKNAYLTVFTDASTPRPGIDDVYFSPTADQSAKLPPPIYQDEDAPIHVPVELVLLILGGCRLAVWWWREDSRGH